jgi:MFS family permease
VNARVWPLHVGGFLGPFGGGVVAVLVPELRDAFHATTTEVAYAVPAYLVPFAIIQLASGTIGERLGRRRVVQIAYLAYAAATIAAGFAPTIGWFLVARAAQGSANAFTTPLLLAGLADLVAPGRLGRAIGTFAGVQAGAVSLAPLIGGVAAAVNWRLAFVAPAIVAVGLVFVPPPNPTRDDREPPRFAAIISRRVVVLCICACAGYAGVTGLPFLVSIRLDDATHLHSTMRGLVLATYGAAGFVFGSAAGRLVERVGASRGAQIAAGAGGLCVVPIGYATGTLTIALLWTAAGCASALLWAGLNTLAVRSSDTNRAGVVGVYQAFKFVGSAAAPLLYLPIYAHSPGAAFAVAALVGMLVIPVVSLVRDTPDASLRSSPQRREMPVDS